MTRNIFYKIIQVMSRKKCKPFAFAESRAWRTAFLFIRGTMPGAVYDALEAALVGAAFLFYIFSRFSRLRF